MPSMRIMSERTLEILNFLLNIFNINSTYFLLVSLYPFQKPRATAPAREVTPVANKATTFQPTNVIPVTVIIKLQLISYKS